MPGSLSTALRIVGTSLFALAVLGGILAAYVTGYQFIHTEKHYLSFGLYGAILGLHLFIQSLFAFLEHRRMRGEGRPVRPGRSVALCIAAYQEDPDYLKKCLRSVKRISFPDLKVVMVVDGNGPDDTYMLDIFHDVMGSEHSGSYVWKSNFHAWGEGETEAGLQEGLARVQALVRGNTYSCILQKWGGKREVMYTAFRALGDSVDYIQVAAWTRRAGRCGQEVHSWAGGVQPGRGAAGGAGAAAGAGFGLCTGCRTTSAGLAKCHQGGQRGQPCLHCCLQGFHIASSEHPLRCRQDVPQAHVTHVAPHRVPGSRVWVRGGGRGRTHGAASGRLARGSSDRVPRVLRSLTPPAGLRALPGLAGRGSGLPGCGLGCLLGARGRREWGLTFPLPLRCVTQTRCWTPPAPPRCSASWRQTPALVALAATSRYCSHEGGCRGDAAVLGGCSSTGAHVCALPRS